MNTARVNELRNRRGAPRFALGVSVRDRYGTVGRIDAIYIDLLSAIESGAVRRDWYEAQERRPNTPEEGRWYSIVTTDGAILAGEDDLEPA